MKIALISCSNNLPVKLHESLKLKGHDVFVIAFKEVKTDLVPNLLISLGQIGKMFNFLKKNNIDNMVLAGSIVRPNLWKFRFDFLGIKFCLQLIKFLKQGDDTLLRFICDFIGKHSVKLWSIVDLCPQFLMPMGCITGHNVSKEIFTSIDFGKNILNQIAQFDIGQSIAIADEIVLGIETIEGTDAMINKVQMIDKKRIQGLSKPVFVKMRKKNQSHLVDLPTIGVDTINNLAQSGFTAAAFEANGCLVLDIDKVIEQAKYHNIALIGFDNHA
jgi:DUF1009 family protein